MPKSLMQHEHMWVKVLSDNGNLIELCRVCGGSNGERFWQQLNDHWDFHYDFGKWFKNKWTRFYKLIRKGN